MRTLRHHLKIASPCPIAEQVEGPGHCRHCDRIVHDLRAIADDDLIALLRGSGEKRICAIIAPPSPTPRFSLAHWQSPSFALAALLVATACTPHGTSPIEPDLEAHSRLNENDDDVRPPSLTGDGTNSPHIPYGDPAPQHGLTIEGGVFADEIVATMGVMAVIVEAEIDPLQLAEAPRELQGELPGRRHLDVQPRTRRAKRSRRGTERSP